jgi:hypothetical protein
MAPVEHGRSSSPPRRRRHTIGRGCCCEATLWWGCVAGGGLWVSEGGVNCRVRGDQLKLQLLEAEMRFRDARCCRRRREILWRLRCCGCWCGWAWVVGEEEGEEDAAAATCCHN